MTHTVPGSMPETLIDSMLDRLGEAPGDDRIRDLLEAEREATRTGRPAFEPGPLCRDHHPCRGPETWHWNNLCDGQGGDLFAWDCLEPAGHGGWCRSEIVTDDISTHRLYWEPPSAGDEYELVVIRSIQPAPHQDGRPFDPDQMRLFELESVPRRRRRSAEDMVVMIDLFDPELSVSFPVIGPPPEG